MIRHTRTAIYEIARLYRWSVTFEAGSALLWTGASSNAFVAPLGYESADRADRNGEAVLRLAVLERERSAGARRSGNWPRVITEVRALSARRDSRAIFEDEATTSVLRGGRL